MSGTIAFTAKISGVPDLLLTLTTPSGPQGIASKIDLPVFHPCVRLARWREHPGELSFVPPDGRFVLAGYEVNLLPIDPDLDKAPKHMEKLFLPAIVDIRKSLGPNNADFEVRLTLNTNFPNFSTYPRPGGGARSGSGTSTPSFLGGGGAGNSSSPILDEVVVTVPIPRAVRNITDMVPSRGDVQWSPGDDVLEWHVPTTKDAGSISGTATLRCTVVGHHPLDDGLDGDDTDFGNGTKPTNLLQGYYDAESYQDPTSSTLSHSTKPKKKKNTKSKKSKTDSTATAVTSEDHLSPSPSQPQSQSQTPTPPPAAAAPSLSLSLQSTRTNKKAQLNASLMPTSASVSFSVRGWLPSGIKVESLTIDPRRSRGLGEGVRPYKGVKYLCLSRRGVERRC